MISKKISVVIPVVRPESAERCIESVKKHLPGAEIVSAVDVDRVGCPVMVNRLVKGSTRELVLFLGDDTEVMEGFEQALEATLSTVDEDWFGVIGVLTQPDNESAHWVAHRKMLDVLPDRQFFNEAYEHCFCDNELTDISNELGRRLVSKEATVKHYHPINYGAEQADAFYKYAYSGGKFARDKVTYIRRKRERRGEKVAIGFPLVDVNVPVQFFTSYACMSKPDTYTLLVPKFPHGPFSGSLADARNSLIEQAQEEGAKYLLMLDTDQTYPADTLEKMLSHRVDICGVRVHRRWMPFDPIFLRGDIGSYENVSDEEAYSGDLIEIDATGTGCLLFNMEVFDKVEYPWFKFGKKDGKPIGEDIYFCSKARAAGLRIFVDTSIEVGHLTTVEVNRFLHQVCKHIKPKVA